MRCPLVWQEFFEPLYGAVLNPGEYIGEPSYGIDALQAACPEQRIGDGRMVCRLMVAAEEIVLSSERQRFDGILREVVVDTVSAVGHVARYARV